MSPENHLIIDWSRSFDTDDLKSKIEGVGLTVSEFRTLSYDDPTIASRFYGQTVKDERFKSPLNIYFVVDPNPNYDYRQTTRGKREVNTNMFDLKKNLRSMIKGQLHATDNPEETLENLKILNIDV